MNRRNRRAHRGPRRTVGAPAKITATSTTITVHHAPLSLKALLVAESQERGESLSLYVARILAGATPDDRTALANAATAEAVAEA